MHRTSLLCASLACFALVVFASIAEAQQPAETKEPAKAPEGWWMLNANTYPPVASWLRHIEGGLSYSNFTGNTSGDIYDTSLSLVLRKRRFSNYWTYSHTLQDITYGGASGRVKMQVLNLYAVGRYDINKVIYAAGAVMKQRNDQFNIENRVISYGGVGIRYTPKPILQLGVLGAFGHVSSTYAAGQQEVSTSGMAPYVEGSAQSQVNKSLTLSLSANYLRFGQGADFGEGDSYQISPAIAIKVSSHVDITISTLFNHEENALITLTKGDRDIRRSSVGFKVSY
jgi:hypothetical protein